MEESYKDSKIFFRKANKIRKPYKPKSAITKNENIKLITDEQSIAEELKGVFQEMLDQPETEYQEQVNTILKTVDL